MRNVMQPLFIQIPRTGCGSINEILQQTGGHRPASWYKQKYPKEWKHFFKFAIVRNPFDRYASILGHFKGVEPPEIVMKPQSWYLDEPMDYIGRFETLEEDWEEIAGLFGIETPLPHRNASKKPLLTPEQRIWVVGEWGADFARFGYDSSE